MSRFFNRKSITVVLIALALVATFLGGVALRKGASPTHAAGTAAQFNNPICSRIGNGIQVSTGARMACFGPQNGNGSANARGLKTASKNNFGTNVDAGNPQEDITPNGTQAYGQSEVSTAAVGPYVAEEWNDATGFFAPCPSPMFKEEGSGYGFSADGGKTFKDLGGLPNNCASGFKLEGDPTVETWRSGGTAYFYFGSLYVNAATGQSDLALNACTASGTGSSATLTCSMPIIIATGGSGDFLDKEFFSIDPIRGRLYTSYTRFGPPTNAATFNGQIELAVCDIATNPAAPTCFPGPSPAPYFVVAPGDANCENEGAYPAVDLAKGDVYVAWEFNWATNIFGPTPCFSAPVQNKVAYVPFSCLTLTPVSPCVTTPLTKAVNIVSMDAAFIPGYNRFPMNDFPRIAVSDQFGAVTIVWNDARLHPYGDILLQSYNLVSLSGVQGSPVRVNSSTAGWHFLPALRNTDDDGDLQISFYQRNSPNTDSTDVYAAIDVSPKTSTTPGSNVRVTTVPSAWFDVSSDIIPNFGDYTDNYVQAQPCLNTTSSAPICTTQTLYVAWSDGRLGDPQPFNAHAHTS